MNFRILPHALAVLALAAAGAAQADDRPRPAPPAAYVQECGACHVPYPADLLAAASWQRLMAGLPRHFGTDASLDAATASSISTWLASHAGSGRRVTDAPPQDRISRSPWFVRKHHEVSTATWNSPAVKSAANCAACHPRADRGFYDEHDIRIRR